MRSQKRFYKCLCHYEKRKYFTPLKTYYTTSMGRRKTIASIERPSEPSSGCSYAQKFFQSYLESDFTQLKATICIDRLPTPLSLKTYHYQTLVSVSSSRFSTQQRKGFKFRFWICVTLSNNQSPCKSRFILKKIYILSLPFLFCQSVLLHDWYITLTFFIDKFFNSSPFLLYCYITYTQFKYALVYGGIHKLCTFKAINLASLSTNNIFEAVQLLQITVF